MSRPSPITIDTKVRGEAWEITISDLSGRMIYNYVGWFGDIQEFRGLPIVLNHNHQKPVEAPKMTNTSRTTDELFKAAESALALHHELLAEAVRTEKKGISFESEPAVELAEVAKFLKSMGFSPQGNETLVDVIRRTVDTPSEDEVYFDRELKAVRGALEEAGITSDYSETVDAVRRLARNYREHYTETKGNRTWNPVEGN